MPRLAVWMGTSLLGIGLLAVPGAAQITTKSFDPVPGDPQLTLGPYQHPAGGNVLRLSVGIGSAAFRDAGDGRDSLWTLADRGPNIACDEAPAVLGLSAAVACPAGPGAPAGAGRLYPRPDYSPSIYRVGLQPDGTFRIVEVVPLQTANGTPITGLPNPLKTASNEVARDGTGAVLAPSPNAIDAEGLVRAPLSGGRFFISEENGPSILEVDARGHIILRHMPAGTENELATAGYAVKGSLPAILAKRRLNRGIESLAVSPDHRFLYFMLQSPLDNPNGGGAVRDSRNLRVFKVRLDPNPSRVRLTPVGEFVYHMAPVSAFQAIGATDAVRQRDLRVSEMTHVADERFLVIERTDQVAVVFEINLAGATNILGGVWDDAATAPSLELTGDLAAAGITPVTKVQRLAASSLAGASPRFPPKLEGMTFMRDGRLLLINDDDFGITGQTTQINLVGGF